MTPVRAEPSRPLAVVSIFDGESIVSTQTGENERSVAQRGGHGHSASYLEATAAIAQAVDPAELDAIALGLAGVRERHGRLFILGVGGGAGHASHAVNDFRKLCHIESYAPTDNVSELTARTNDDGWETSFSAWLATSRLCARDALLVFSVGGGSRERGVSINLVHAMEAARKLGASIYGVVGAPGGTLAEVADVAILIEPPAALRTPLVESLQAVLWHGLVSHPSLALKQGHWESLTAAAPA
jgi:D-sedoheptulose 7-phosphate isomerase